MSGHTVRKRNFSGTGYKKHLRFLVPSYQRILHSWGGMSYRICNTERHLLTTNGVIILFPLYRIRNYILYLI